jgi:hypothetical protein
LYTRSAIAIVVALVFFTQELDLVAHEWEAHHDPLGVVVDGDALLNHLLLKGLLQALCLFPGGLAADRAVATGVATEVGDVLDIPLVHKTLEL